MRPRLSFLFTTLTMSSYVSVPQLVFSLVTLQGQISPLQFQGFARVCLSLPLDWVLTLSWLRFSPAYCMYPYLMHDLLFLFPKLFPVPKISSLFYPANQTYLLSGLYIFSVNLVMSALGQEACFWKYEAFVWSCRYSDDIEEIIIMKFTLLSCTTL